MKVLLHELLPALPLRSHCVLPAHCTVTDSFAQYPSLRYRRKSLSVEKTAVDVLSKELR